MATRERVKPEAGNDRRHVVGSDHPDRRQPRHLHEDRLRQPRGRRVQGTSSLFRGYSVFMKGKDPRDAHFITSRICGICGDNHAVCSLLRAEHGLRRQDAAAGRVDRQPRRGGRVHLRPHHLPGQPGVRGLLRADGQGDQPERAGEGREDRRAARRRPRLPDDRRHHARRTTRSRARRTARRCT